MARNVGFATAPAKWQYGQLPPQGSGNPAVMRSYRPQPNYYFRATAGFRREDKTSAAGTDHRGTRLARGQAERKQGLPTDLAIGVATGVILVG